MRQKQVGQEGREAARWEQGARVEAAVGRQAGAKSQRPWRQELWGQGRQGHWFSVHLIHLSARHSVPHTKVGISRAGSKPCPSDMLGQALKENKKCPRAPGWLSLDLGVQRSSSMLGVEITQNKTLKKRKCPKWPLCDLKSIISLLSFITHRIDYYCLMGCQWTRGVVLAVFSRGEGGIRARRPHPDPRALRSVSGSCDVAASVHRESITSVTCAGP